MLKMVLEPPDSGSIPKRSLWFRPNYIHYNSTNSPQNISFSQAIGTHLASWSPLGNDRFHPSYCCIKTPGPDWFIILPWGVLNSFQSSRWNLQFRGFMITELYYSLNRS